MILVLEYYQTMVQVVNNFDKYFYYLNINVNSRKAKYDLNVFLDKYSHK